MKTIAFGVALCVTLGAPALVTAQTGNPFDHLQCFKVRDPLKARYLADLVPLQMPPFDLAKGCYIVAPAKLFCIPVQKTHVQPPAPLSVNGKRAQDYLVYKLRCPIKDVTKTLNVKDQFGARALVVGRHQVILVPAFKQSNLCRNTSVPGAPPVCGGDCSNPNQKCTQLPGTTDCSCQSPCGLNAAGQCGGECPYPDQDCRIHPNADGTLGCSCTPTVPGCALVDPASGQCGGPCANADEKCVLGSNGTCQCEAPCGATGLRRCGGLCPTAAENCVVKPDDSGCECRPTTPQPCSLNTAGQCGGTCPNNQPCVASAAAGCVCGPLTGDPTTNPN